jgi:hypothetical protein
MTMSILWGAQAPRVLCSAPSPNTFLDATARIPPGLPWQWLPHVRQRVSRDRNHGRVLR